MTKVNRTPVVSSHGMQDCPEATPPCYCARAGGGGPPGRGRRAPRGRSTRCAAGSPRARSGEGPGSADATASEVDGGGEGRFPARHGPPAPAAILRVDCRTGPSCRSRHRWRRKTSMGRSLASFPRHSFRRQFQSALRPRRSTGGVPDGSSREDGGGKTAAHSPPSWRTLS